MNGRISVVLSAVVVRKFHLRDQYKYVVFVLFVLTL